MPGIERRIIRAVLGAAAFLLVVRTKVDADLWGHVRFGSDILRTGLVEHDPYSFTSDIPWVNHEWLAEVSFWLAWTTAGGLGLVLLKVCVVGVMLAAAWDVLRHRALPPLAVEALGFVLLFGTWARTSVIRPQLFSLALFALLLWVLQSVERGHHRRLWLTPVIFLLWINLHGGLIVGFGILGLYGAVSFASKAGRNRLPALAAVGAASALTLLVNPYGTEMLAFIANTVRLDRSDINDWQPMWGNPLVVGLWLCSVAIGVYTLARHWRSVAPWQIAMVAVLCAASMRVSRLDAFFAIAVAMLLGPHLGAERTNLATRSRHPAPMLAAVATALGIIVGTSTSQPLSCIGLDLPWAPERESGAFIATNRLKGRLLTWFDWGQYVIWHFGPDLKVSVDGRRETVYSERFLRLHDELSARPDQNLDLLRSLNADYAWLPVRLPLVKQLDQEGWIRIFNGPISVVFARRAGEYSAVAGLEGTGCFPGP